MKIAIVSDDEQTVSQHFGRAEKYIVFTFVQNNMTGRKTLPKPGHRHFTSQHMGKHSHRADAGGRGFGNRAKGRHEQMFENISDCDILVSRGMGRGAYLDLKQLGIKPIVSDIQDIGTVIKAILDETIIDHVDKLH